MWWGTWWKGGVGGRCVCGGGGEGVEDWKHRPGEHLHGGGVPLEAWKVLCWTVSVEREKLERAAASSASHSP